MLHWRKGVGLFRRWGGGRGRRERGVGRSERGSGYGGQRERGMGMER